MTDTLSSPFIAFSPIATLRSLFADSSTSSSKKKSLLSDEKGAVMMTGLFMSCFLIGALWFIVGIGDAVVFRDKMQEAADHGAFTSAALHAKGMNFISLCNLVMLIGTVIHIVLGIISDIKFAIMVACALAVPCWPDFPDRLADFESAYNMWDRYFTMMSKAFKAIHTAQKVASYAYPAMGVVQAYQVGSKYGGDSRTSSVTVVAASSSILPGAAARAMGGSGVKKEGLPVEAKEFSELCKKVVSVASTGLVNLIGLGKSVSGSSLGGRALSIFNSVVGTVLQFRYCNKQDLHFQPLGPGFDSFWGEDGPYVVYSAASNGNTWMQTWAINVAPKLNDTSESHVGIAAKKYQKYTKQVGSLGYFAQAEFYFDCDSDWTSAACNYEDNATFAIKWRARMRRLEVPAITSGAVGAALGGLTNLESFKGFKDALSGDLANALANSGIGRQAMKGAIDSVFQQFQDFVTGKATDAAGGFDPTFSNLGISNFH